MESYRTFIKNNRSLLIGHLLIYAQGIILMPIVIKSAGVVVYGGYILLSGLVGFIFGISSFGVGFNCGRFLPGIEAREEKRDIFYPQFWFQFLMLVILALIFDLFYPGLNRFLIKGEFVFSKWLVSILLVSNLFYSQASSYFLSTHRIHHFNFATVALPYINLFLILAIYWIKKDLSLNMLFLTQIITYLLIGIPLSVLLFREIGVKLILPDLKQLKNDMRLGIPLRLNFIMDVVLSFSDRYVITYFLSVAAVGYYNPGYAIGSLTLFLPRVLGVVLLPLLSKAIDSHRENEAYNMLSYAIKAFLLVSIPFVFGSIVLSAPLLNLFANAEVSQRAYMVTPIIALATLFFGLNIILSNVLWVRLKTAIIFKMNMLAALINLMLNLILLNLFRDVRVAALTTLISYFIAFIFIYNAVIRVWPIRLQWQVVVKIVIAAVFMSGFLYGVSFCPVKKIYNPWFLLIEIMAAIIAYLFALVFLKAFSSKELKYLKNSLAFDLS